MLKIEIRNVSFRFFALSDLLGVKVFAKKVDMLGNLKVFVLRVGCWGG